MAWLFGAAAHFESKLNKMKLGFALEYSLGHITHADNLKRVLKNESTLSPFYVDLPYDGMKGQWTKLPGVRSNWSMRASIGAYLGLRAHANSLDAALFHTQVTSLLSPGFMAKVPSVVSLDATPLQYDSLGAFYGHTPSSNPRLEAIKKRMNERSFLAAKHLVTWSEWAKQSLVTDYGIAGEKITVIPPGIDIERWDFPVRSTSGHPVKLLFVGGDFKRKGGETLLDAVAPLLSRGSAELHIVTKTEAVAVGLDNVKVHYGLAANSPELLKLYASADIFVFPTRGDCLPLAVMEALASGLPVITTNVGALSEAVHDGETGLIVPVDDVAALRAAVEHLIADGMHRINMGARARVEARARFNAATNYARLVNIVQHAGK